MKERECKNNRLILRGFDIFVVKKKKKKKERKFAIFLIILQQFIRFIPFYGHFHFRKSAICRRK